MGIILKNIYIFQILYPSFGNLTTHIATEYTSKRNRSYLGINIHNASIGFANLGLVRIHGSMPSEELYKLVDLALDKFDLKIENDIISATSDGASIMTKWGRMISCLHIQCMAHAVHLGKL